MQIEITIRYHLTPIRIAVLYIYKGNRKDRNGRDLTEAEDIKKRWQEHTEEMYKKCLHDPDDHNGVITHLEPDILECGFGWILGVGDGQGGLAFCGSWGRKELDTSE